ncbi:tripartite tricarboxylate transporter substrate binding protein [Methylibium sp.]|uniref:Bug family tripartite tricarboxylate transporter substrate binding protein n=1 Tax=Methylibium sp. TaxID=2067992 RepID=UPI0017C56D17|nr:tripartite tricarboxylate transporter substrate binding protein [Methylibium sp.]MBA3590937.1 tripartite tricarboxylate transporter substrate binding protein [Methylibium sp.]
MNRFVRRRAILQIIGFGCAAVASAGAAAQAYPDKPIRMLVPFGAGGITDLVARATAEQLGKELGQQVVVENKPGAGGNIAAEQLTRSAPDGYTLMLTTIGLVSVNPHTYDKVPFDSFKDFSYISTVASTPHAIVLNPSVAADSLPALIALAKKQPEGLSFGTAGFGSSPHQGLEILQASTNTRLLHVPYKSGAESVTSVLGGQVSMTFEALPVVMPHVATGKLKAVAIAAPKRHGSAKELPTTAELGFPAIQSASVSGLIPPAGVPASIVDTLNKATKKALDDPALQEMLFKQGTNVAGSTPEEFRALMAEEHQKWGRLMKAAAAAKK